MKDKILLEVSARHVHLCEADLKTLYGDNAKLIVKKKLSQPGQYAAEQRVDVIGEKNSLKNVSILGPCRGKSQVEVSLTDARVLGVDAPVRESGELEGSAAVMIVGPMGVVRLTEGCIVAKRHIHLTPEAAEEQGVANGEIVSVRVESPLGRSLVFDDVVIRVSSSFSPAMHIDTDEANACGAKGLMYATIIKNA